MGTTREVGVTTLVIPNDRGGWSGRTWTDEAVDKTKKTTKKTEKVKKKDKTGAVVACSINLI